MNNNEKKELAYRINLIRILRNETLEEFAEQIKKKTNFKIKTTKSNVSKWEKGLNVPNDITLNAIAELGDISIDELLYGPLEQRVIRSITLYQEKNNCIFGEIETRDVADKVTRFFKKQHGYSPSNEEIENLVMAEFLLKTPINRMGQLDLNTGEIHTKDTLINNALSNYEQLKEKYSNITNNVHQDTIQEIISITDEAIEKLKKL